MARIVIDARNIDSSTGNYGRNLLKYLEKLESDHHFIVITATDDSSWSPTADNFEEVKTDIAWYSLSEQLKLPRLLKSLKPDLVHFLMPQQPLLYFGKRVTTVHDLTLVYYQNLDKNKYIYGLEQSIFKFLLKNVTRRSSYCITPTEFIKKQLSQFAGIAMNKIVVTLESGGPIDEQAEAVKQLVDKQFLFHVSNAFPYKNLQLLIDAYAEVKKQYPDLQLALAGKKEYFYQQLEQKTIDDGVKDVHFLGFVSDGQKKWLYLNGLADVNPSRSEGFGLQCLEAMVHDTTMVLSNSTVLPEVAGDTSLYFDPDRKDQLVDQLKKVLVDNDEIKILKSRYKKRLSQFSWQKMAKETLAVYQDALK